MPSQSSLWLSALITASSITAAGTAACENDVVGEALTGRWEQDDGSSELVFEEDGSYRFRMETSDGPEHMSGRYRLGDSADRHGLWKLETCLDGAACESGGIWTTQHIVEPSDDRLIIHQAQDPASTRRVYRRR